MILKTRTENAKEIGTLKNEQGLTLTEQTREDELKNKMMQICEKVGYDKSLATRFLNFLLYP